MPRDEPADRKMHVEVHAVLVQLWQPHVGNGLPPIPPRSARKRTDMLAHLARISASRRSIRQGAQLFEPVRRAIPPQSSLRPPPPPRHAPAPDPRPNRPAPTAWAAGLRRSSRPPLPHSDTDSTTSPRTMAEPTREPGQRHDRQQPQRLPHHAADRTVVRESSLQGRNLTPRTRWSPTLCALRGRRL
jgi:hypothetical protein